MACPATRATAGSRTAGHGHGDERAAHRRTALAQLHGRHAARGRAAGRIRGQAQEARRRDSRREPRRFGNTGTHNYKLRNMRSVSSRSLSTVYCIRRQERHAHGHAHGACGCERHGMRTEECGGERRKAAKRNGNTLHSTCTHDIPRHSTVPRARPPATVAYGSSGTTHRISTAPGTHLLFLSRKIAPVRIGLVAYIGPP